jgi:Kef-type K+ transport system membrane component KefB
MRKVLIYSLLLVLGLVLSQAMPIWVEDLWSPTTIVVNLATMAALSFIMIHIGYEFEMDRTRPKKLAIDYGVAMTAATFPWIFVTLYFLFVLGPGQGWYQRETLVAALLAARFAAPTSAGVLFSMLSAAGLSATWVFRKARILAIFDDLDTVLLMIPLKMLYVGVRWEMGAIVLIMLVQLVLAWRCFRRLRWSARWPAVMAYAVIITAISEAIYLGTKLVEDIVTIHIEVLLPAFVLGCILAHQSGGIYDREEYQEDGFISLGRFNPQTTTGIIWHTESIKSYVRPGAEEHYELLEEPSERKVSSIVSGVFMILVGLSMPTIAVMMGGADFNWGEIGLHVLAVTVLANIGKMFPAFVYRREATFRERLAVSICMWPRGEVGAGVLILSLSYGIMGPMILVAALSLALNLVLTGFFILIVKRLLRGIY